MNGLEQRSRELKIPDSRILSVPNYLDRLTTFSERYKQIQLKAQTRFETKLPSSESFESLQEFSFEDSTASLLISKVNEHCLDKIDSDTLLEKGEINNLRIYGDYNVAASLSEEIKKLPFIDQLQDLTTKPEISEFINDLEDNIKKDFDELELQVNRIIIEKRYLREINLTKDTYEVDDLLNKYSSTNIFGYDVAKYTLNHLRRLNNKPKSDDNTYRQSIRFRGHDGSNDEQFYANELYKVAKKIGTTYDNYDLDELIKNTIDNFQSSTTSKKQLKGIFGLRNLLTNEYGVLGKTPRAFAFGKIVFGNLSSVANSFTFYSVSKMLDKGLDDTSRYAWGGLALVAQLLSGLSGLAEEHVTDRAKERLTIFNEQTEGIEKHVLESLLKLSSFDSINYTEISPYLERISGLINRLFEHTINKGESSVSLFTNMAAMTAMIHLDDSKNFSTFRSVSTLLSISTVFGVYNAWTSNRISNQMTKHEEKLDEMRAEKDTDINNAGAAIASSAKTDSVLKEITKKNAGIVIKSSFASIAEKKKRAIQELNYLQFIISLLVSGVTLGMNEAAIGVSSTANQHASNITTIRQNLESELNRLEQYIKDITEDITNRGHEEPSSSDIRAVWNTVDKGSINIHLESGKAYIIRGVASSGKSSFASMISGNMSPKLKGLGDANFGLTNGGIELEKIRCEYFSDKVLRLKQYAETAFSLKDAFYLNDDSADKEYEEVYNLLDEYDLLKRLGIHGLEDLKYKIEDDLSLEDLSGGTKDLLNILSLYYKAKNGDYRTIIIDEKDSSTSGEDQDNIFKLIKKINEEKGKDCIMLIISHNKETEHLLNNNTSLGFEELWLSQQP